MPDRLSPIPSWTLELGDACYPACLAECPRPPAVLRGYGDRALLRPGIAIVGARRATPYGIACARRFAGWAAERGVIVISGAAYGCDSAAHEGAIEGGGSTVAVLGCGADVDYPPSSSGLLATLRQRHAVVSESPWGAPPVPYAFPNRNRIIAGLAAIVLVVEATPKSGTFSTVEHANEAGRDVCVVPGSVFSETSRGCNTLLREGAAPIADEADLVDALERAGLVRHRRPAAPLVGGPGLGGNTIARRLTAALAADPMRLDEAARALGITVIEAAAEIARLEAEGVLTRASDGRYGALDKR